MSLVAQIDKLAKRVAQQFNAAAAATAQQVGALSATTALQFNAQAAAIAAQAITSGANWVRLPTGLILQWGRFDTETLNIQYRGNGYFSAFVPFNVAFPNRTLNVFIQRTLEDGGALEFGTGDGTATVDENAGVSRAGFSMLFEDDAAGRNLFYWFALGQ
jgi:hypothetical protein